MGFTRLAGGGCLLLAVTLAVAAAGCGGGNAARDRQSVVVDGSSTVGPLMQRAAVEFQLKRPAIDVDVEISRTSQGFERFCSGDIEIANASRPIDED